jgi:DNA-binding NarL/FixJ family response regulator
MSGGDDRSGMTAGARVVVVDDHPDAGRTVCAVLGAAGFEAVTTRDATAATESVASEGVAVVVVAHAAGNAVRSADLVRTLRSSVDPTTRDVSVLALVDDAGGADAALVAGADSVLIRPVEAERIVEAVTEVAATDASVRADRRRSR